MGLTEKQKEEIKKFCSTKDITEFEISDLAEMSLDHLIDEDFVDLSDDDIEPCKKYFFRIKI